MIDSPARELFDALLDDRGHDGDRPAVTFISADGGERTYTREHLRAEVLGIAERLPRTDGLVSILVRTQEEQFLHYLACLAGGLRAAVLTPPNRKLEPTYYGRTLAAVLATIAPAYVVTDLQEVVEGIDAPTLPGIVAPRANAVTPARGAGVPRTLPDEAAFVQFSSGTTGIKKGVAVSAGAMRAQLSAYGEAIGFVREDVVVGWLPLYHDMGFVTGLHLPLLNGAHTVLLDPIDWVGAPSTYLRAVSRHGGTVGWHPNFAYAFMAKRVSDQQLDGLDLSTIRLLANCSEPVTLAAQTAFADRFAPTGLRRSAFAGCYAMAETTFAVTHLSDSMTAGLDSDGPTSGELRGRTPVVSVGRSLPGVTIAVRDERGADLPDGVVGELHVRAPFLALGYVGEPEQAGALQHDWYRTGDLGYVKRGHVFVTGRKKDVLIVAGTNVYPEDIENIVSATPGLRDGRAAAFAVFDERTQTDAVTVLAEPQDAGAEPDLLGAMRAVQAELQIGVRLHLVQPGWLIKSSSGKISRSASAQKWASSQSAPVSEAGTWPR